jgi:hypothetical protein
MIPMNKGFVNCAYLEADTRNLCLLTCPPLIEGRKMAISPLEPVRLWRKGEIKRGRDA